MEIVKITITGKAHAQTLLQSVTTHDGQGPLSHLSLSDGLVSALQKLFCIERQCTLLIRIPEPQVTEHYKMYHKQILIKNFSINTNIVF